VGLWWSGTVLIRWLGSGQGWHTDRAQSQAPTLSFSAARPQLEPALDQLSIAEMSALAQCQSERAA
jgi:hypothetical protein